MARADKRRHYQVTFVTLVVGVAGYALLQSLVLPVLPTIQHSLHTSQDTVTWVLTAYLLSASVFTPILGRVGDMVGKERMFVVALAALAAGSLLAAVATSIGVMIVARAIQGVGGGSAAVGVRDHPRRVPPGKGGRCHRQSPPPWLPSAAVSASSWLARSSMRSTTTGCSGFR